MCGACSTLLSYTLAMGLASLSGGLATGLSGLGAGMCIGIVGDAGVRASAQQPRLYVIMVLILIFSEALGLYGLIVVSGEGGTAVAFCIKLSRVSCRVSSWPARVARRITADLPRLRK